MFFKKDRGIFPSSTQPHLSPYRWVILFLVWLLYVTHGFVGRSAAPLVTPMLKDLAMSYGQMGFVLGSWQLVYMMVAVFSGIVLDKWGLRKSLFLGALIIGVSSVSRYFANSFGMLLPMVALFGVGGSVISIGAPKAISMWFAGKDRGTAVGIYTTGPWFGQMFVLAATNSIVMPLAGYSWRLTFVYYGMLCFGAASLWWFFGREAGYQKTTGHQNFTHVIVRLFKVHNVQILLLAGFFSFAIIHGFANWLPKILENSGISAATAGLYSSFPFLVGIPTVLIIPRMIPARLWGKAIALFALISGAATFLVISSSVPLLFGLFLYGISIPPQVPLLILLLMETPEVGSEHMGSAGGMFFCISDMGGFFGPLVMGFLVDLTGLFLAGAVFLALLGCAIFGLMFLLKANN